MNLQLINSFGYSEMYEWVDSYENKFVGRLVQFDEEGKIRLAQDPNETIGVSTINFCSVSDNPDKWPYKYILNEYGDILLKEKTLAYGKSEYDTTDEFAYISTHAAKIYVPKEHSTFDSSKEYVKRTDRQEWIPVNIIGKCIIFDNGTCNNDQKYCQLYNGDDTSLYGSVVPVYSNDVPKYRILERFSPKTLLIYYK